jgi:hypothetical protein
MQDDKALASHSSPAETPREHILRLMQKTLAYPEIRAALAHKPITQSPQEPSSSTKT